MLVNVVLLTALGLFSLGFLFSARWRSRRGVTTSEGSRNPWRSPGLPQALGWGANIGWVGGICVATEGVWAHGYPQSGLWRIALELGREDVLSTAIVPLVAAAGAWGVTRAHPRLRAWSAPGVWFAPVVALAVVLMRYSWPATLATARQIASPHGLAFKLALGGLAALAAGFAGVLTGAIWRWQERRQPALLPGSRALAAGAAVGLVVLCSLELGHRRAQHTPAPAGPNIVLISVDTLRSDFLSCYGNPAPTSPQMDLLASSGIRFANALSQSPWTMPSMATVLTSLYPSQHRANGVRSRLGRGVDTLAEILRNAGYHTLGVVSHDFVDGRHGFAQGFASFDDRHILGHDEATSGLVSRTALALLYEAPTEPFFLWTHYFDPHFRYLRHSGFELGETEDPTLEPAIEDAILHGVASGGQITADQVEYFRAAYREEVAFTDDWIGKLMAGVRRVAGERSTVFILTADHGEYFMERQRFGHGRDVYRELIHVPLIIGGDLDPELRGKVIDETVEIAGIPATVLGLAGLEAGQIRGPDLLQLARGQAEAAPCFMEGSYAGGDDDRKLGVVFDGWKLIRHFDDRRLELYDTRSDPGERVDLVDRTEPEVVAARDRLLHRLDLMETELRGSSPDPGAADQSLKLSAEEIERLRSLGYLQ